MKFEPQNHELEKQPGWESGEKPGLDQEQWRQVHYIPRTNFLTSMAFISLLWDCNQGQEDEISKNLVSDNMGPVPLHPTPGFP